MIKKYSIYILFFVFSAQLFSQTSAISDSYSFDIRKKIEPPILSIENVRFIDEDGNNAINASESCKLEFKVVNTGKGDALNLKSLIKAVGTTSGINFLNSEALPKIDKLGGSKTFFIDIKSDDQTVDGNIDFTLEVEEPNGFNYHTNIVYICK